MSEGNWVLLLTTKDYKETMRWCRICKGTVFAYDDQMECKDRNGVVHAMCWNKYNRRREVNFCTLYSGGDVKPDSSCNPRIVKHGG